MSDKPDSKESAPIKPVSPSLKPGTPVKRDFDVPKPSIKPVKPSSKTGTPYRFHDKHK